MKKHISFIFILVLVFCASVNAQSLKYPYPPGFAGGSGTGSVLQRLGPSAGDSVWVLPDTLREPYIYVSRHNTRWGVFVSGRPKWDLVSTEGAFWRGLNIGDPNYAAGGVSPGINLWSNQTSIVGGVQGLGAISWKNVPTTHNGGNAYSAGYIAMYNSPTANTDTWMRFAVNGVSGQTTEVLRLTEHSQAGFGNVIPRSRIDASGGGIRADTIIAPLRVVDTTGWVQLDSLKWRIVEWKKPSYTEAMTGGYNAKGEVTIEIMGKNLVTSARTSDFSIRCDSANGVAFSGMIATINSFRENYGGFSAVTTYGYTRYGVGNVYNTGLIWATGTNNAKIGLYSRFPDYTSWYSNGVVLFVSDGGTDLSYDITLVIKYVAPSSSPSTLPIYITDEF